MCLEKMNLACQANGSGIWPELVFGLIDEIVKNFTKKKKGYVSLPLNVVWLVNELNPGFFGWLNGWYVNL